MALRPEVLAWTPVFIGGAGRSGTTLLRSMLGGHRDLYAPVEFKSSPHVATVFRAIGQDLSRLCDAYGIGQGTVDAAFGGLLYDLLQPSLVHANKARLVEKTPHNCLMFADLQRWFSNAMTIHVVRDGRDVVASLLDQDWVSPETRETLSICQDVRAAATYWAECVNKGEKVWDRNRHLTVRYEDLVRDPRAELSRVLEFLDEDWDDAVLDDDDRAARAVSEVVESSTAQVAGPITDASIGRWRSSISTRDLIRIDAILWPGLLAHGYA